MRFDIPGGGRAGRLVAIAVCWACAAVPAQQIGYHEARTDSAGGIVPWYGSGPAEAYDHVIRLVWNFWRDMRQCPNGLPYYLQHQVWRPLQDDPRGLGGDQLSMALSSWNLLYGYSGDSAIKENMMFLADYWLDRGMSQPSDLWPNLPYPYETELHSGVYDGDMVAGKGYLQPDKAASFGAELVMLYKTTGKRRYLDAAVGVANTLAGKVQPGDAANSPWPFRVHARTGAVHQETTEGKTLTASYTSNWTGALRLFTALTELKQGNLAAYSGALRMAAAWLNEQSLRTNKWGPFFEDIATSNWSDTAINADTLAAYIAEHPEWSPRWRETVKSILDWTYRTFANRHYEQWNVVPINEQTAYPVEGNSHTARHAALELLYGEKTGDHSLKEAAIRRLNWATYWAGDDGRNRYPNSTHWLTDGYGDYVRHFLRAMASAPELAPQTQNHLLRTSSIVQTIDYSARRITYSKFDATSVEMFKMGATPPKSVQGGRMQWNPATKVLIVRAKTRSVVIVM
ncbi:MAG: hypothetical protein NTW28_26175 [Candidatus Solibacter sp.]|nr:hypothetical protein [Candidatus Solibacter sp.]